MLANLEMESDSSSDEDEQAGEDELKDKEVSNDEEEVQQISEPVIQQVITRTDKSTQPLRSVSKGNTQIFARNLLFFQKTKGYYL